MKIAIAQFHTSHCEYAEFSEELNKTYADEKGYQYYLINDTEKIKKEIEDRAFTWYKPLLIQQCIQDTDADWILYLDMDAVVSDRRFLIEDFLDENYNIVAFEDVGHHSVFNAGVLLLKNDEWTRDFLKRWWEASSTFTGTQSRDLPLDETLKDELGYFKNRLWHDQTCLTILYESDPEVRKRIKVSPCKELNVREFDTGVFVYHAYAYGHLQYRGIDTLLRSINSRGKVFPRIRLVVYHVYCVNDYLEVVKEQFSRLKSSGVYDWCDKIEVTATIDHNVEHSFEPLEDIFRKHPKVNLTKVNTNDYEYESIKKVWDYSQKYQGEVLYIHAKGVTNKFKNLATKQISERKRRGIKWWREIMEYYLIDNFRDCLRDLENSDQCGVTLVNNWWWGNFWWSNLDWVHSNLQPEKGDRWYFEAWLNRTRTPKAKQYYNFEFNPYLTNIPASIYLTPEKYKDSKIELVSAFYGSLGEQIDEGRPFAERQGVDVSKELLANLSENNFRGFGINVNNNIKGDPLFGIPKMLEVIFKVEDENFVVVVDENKRLNFTLP